MGTQGVVLSGIGGVVLRWVQWEWSSGEYRGSGRHETRGSGPQVSTMLV